LMSEVHRNCMMHTYHYTIIVLVLVTRIYLVISAGGNNQLLYPD
jgi:hypothetical protein